MPARTAFLDSDEAPSANEQMAASVFYPDGVSTINGSYPLGKFFTPPEMDFGDEDYLPAGNVETVAQWLIGRMPEFAHLLTARISYFWKAKGGKSGGKVTLGRAQKSSGFTAWVTETDFLMFISADHCRDMSITNYQMEALIYHELCHMSIEEVLDKDGEPTGETRYAIAAHDVTAFHNEIERYGGWLPELRQNRNTWEQVALKENERVEAIEEGNRDAGI